MSVIQMLNKIARTVAPLYRWLIKVLSFVFLSLITPLFVNYLSGGFNIAILDPKFVDPVIEFIKNHRSLILYLMLFSSTLTLLASIGKRQRDIEKNFGLGKTTVSLKIEDLNLQKVEATDSDDIKKYGQSQYRPFFGTYYPRMAVCWTDIINDETEMDCQVGEDELERIIRQGKGGGFLLIGPPLSGKTCTIFHILRRMKSFTVVRPHSDKAVPDQQIFNLLKKRNVIILLDDLPKFPSDYDLTLFCDRLNKATAGSYAVMAACRGGGDFVTISTGPSNQIKSLFERLAKFRLSSMTIKDRIKLAETTGEPISIKDAWRYPLPGRITLRRWIDRLQENFHLLDEINKDALRTMKLLSASNIAITFDRLLVGLNQVFGYASGESKLKSILHSLWVDNFLLKIPTRKKLSEYIDFGILEWAVTYNEEGSKPNEARWDTLEEVLVATKDAEALLSLSYTYNQNGVRYLDRSLRALDAVLLIDPDNASGHYHRGYTLAHLKRLSEALEANTRAIQLHGDFAEAYNNRGWIYLLRGEFKEAEAALLHALKLQPEYDGAHTNLGIVYAKTDRKEEALNAFNDALCLRQNYYAYLCMGITLSRQDSFEEALAAYDKALEDRPNYPKAYLNRGITLARWGSKERSIDKYEKALEAQKQAIVLDPDYAEAYMYLGQTYALLERYPESRDALTRAIEIQPDNPMAYHNRARTFGQMREFQLALDDCDRAIELQPEWAEAHLSRGILLARPKFKRLLEAVAALEKATSLDPDNAEAHMNLGIPLARLKRYDEALDAYKQAMHLDKNNVEIYMNLAHTLVKIGGHSHLKEAVTVYDRVLELRESAEVHLRRGIALARMDQFEKAVDALEKATELNPDNAEAHMNLGVTLARMDQFEKAVHALKKATELNPDNAEAHMNLGVTLARLQSFDEALEAFDEAIKVKPNYAEAFFKKAHTLCFHRNAPKEMDRFGQAIVLLEKAVFFSPSIWEKLDRLKYSVFYDLATHTDYGSRFANLFS